MRKKVSIPLKTLMISSILRTGLCLLLLSGCAVTDFPIGVPARPDLIPLPSELQREIPPDALDIIAVNDAMLKSHILKLEGRITLHDASL